jgi:hypothetical protein
MATPFLKVDLSPGARDFEQAALDPGVPLLDRTGTHYRTLKKWLGRLIAEPEWKGTEVSFFVCDDKGARPHDIRCEAASVSDRASVKGLKEDMEAIKRRLQEAKPDVKEQRLHQALVRHFNAAVNPTGPKQSEYYFFRYLDHGTWRLAWCWGYQRKDVVPAVATICTNPACRQLFLRRQEGSRDCPGCSSTAVAKPKAKSGLAKYAMITVIIALIAAGLGYAAKSFWPNNNSVIGPTPTTEGLLVMPADWSGPAGAQLIYKVVQKAKVGEEDVTAQVVPVAENPKIARVDRSTGKIHARSAGKTTVVFYLGDQKAEATVSVRPPEQPTSIKLDPAEVTLGIGTTAQLRVQGEVAGQWLDLTESAEWESIHSRSVSCQAGKLEGLAEGEATVVARYRATDGDEYRRAEAKIKVVKEKYTKLELAVSPTSFKEGTDAALKVQVATAEGTQRPVLNSSLLTLHIDLPNVAAVEGELLRGLRAGKGKLSGKFGELTANADFTVENDPSRHFIVSPQSLKLMVGELAELQVSSASIESIRVVSSTPSIVAIESELKVVGRAPGKAELTIKQEAREAKIEVEVVPANIKSLAFVPPRLSVPVDRPTPLRIVGQTNDNEQIDLAAEAITWEELPQADVVELDPQKLELLGRQATDESPQTMIARVGQLRATGLIDVVPGALQLELTPSGSTPLPVGQSLSLHAFAQYGGGARTEIDPSRIEWKVEPANASELTFDPRTATVIARQADSTLKVKASYQGFTSSEIEIRSITQDLALTLHADHAVILVGDSGQLEVKVQGAPLDLSLIGTTFTTSDDKLLTVDKQSGGYHALAAGKVTVTAEHPNAKSPAIVELEVVDRSAAKLVVKPEKLQLLVNGRQNLELTLMADSHEEAVSLIGDDVPLVAIGQPEAVRWQPPLLTGARAAGPFEITLEYAGKSARAVVEVVAGDGPIRVVPDKKKLSAGQSLSPRVEQNLSGDVWQELDPTKITWKVPDNLDWTPARGELRPQLTPPEGASGTLALEASYAGKTANLAIEVVGDAPPKGPLAVVREPGGEDVAVGSAQRYTIVVNQGDKQTPAVGVQWQPAFENEFARWDPPTLYAKQSGHEQLLWAAVGEDRITFPVRTVDLLDLAAELATPTEKPTEVRIIAGQPQPIVLPQGTRFSSFHVEAVYPDRPAVNVTRESLLKVAGASDASSPISVQSGEVICQNLGDAELGAEFNGVSTTQNLRFKVVKDVELTSLEISPSSVRLGLGQSASLRVTGFVGKGNERYQVGDVTSLAILKFASDKPEVVKGDSPTLTGLTVGKATITATAGGVSAKVDAEVVAADSISGDLTVLPRVLRLRVGESQQLGSDVRVYRGGADVTDQVGVESISDDLVRYHRSSRSFEGISPGEAEISLDLDGLTLSLPVQVIQGSEIADGQVVIEPASGTLAVGESFPLRVFLVGASGDRINRTASATFTSSDGAILSAAGSKITGIADGEATIKASLSKDLEASASFKVVAEKFTSLEVTPSRVKLAIGQRKPLKIEAVGPVGRRQFGEHPDLQIAIGGSDTNCVQWSGGEVRGVSPGKATLQATWQGLQSPPVAVVVTDDPITGLRIDPRAIRVDIGGTEQLRVYVRRGREEDLVTADDGLKISLADPTVAEAGEDLIVTGQRAGTTTLTAQLGSQRAAGQVTVRTGKGGGFGYGGSVGYGRGPRNSKGGRGGTMVGPNGVASGPGGTGVGPGTSRGGPSGGRDTAVQLPPGLRFIPDRLRLQVGVPAPAVRLVYVGRDGATVDLDRQPTFDVSPENGKDIVGMGWSAAGPQLTAKQPGEAQVSATSGKLTTAKPLRVIVEDSKAARTASPPRLDVQPDPVRLIVGQTGRLRRVQLVNSGEQPIDIRDYKLESANENVVAIEGTELRGISAGHARVSVRALNLPASFGAPKTDVMVYVEPPATLTAKGSRLVLTGPTRVTVGSPGQFRVELRDVDGRDVTNDGATLVLDADQESLATLKPGCVLAGKAPGALTVRARYKDQVSNAQTVRIDPISRDFASLEIEVERHPLVIGERRSYRLWGYPVGGGARQDVTHQISADESAEPVVRVKGSTADVVSHVPPVLLAQKAGQFGMAAKLGSLTSETVKLEVVEAALENVQLTADPASVSIFVGSQTPPLRLLARSPGDRDNRAVDATWSSENEDVAASVAGSPNQFVGKSAGRTRLKATFNGQNAFVDVTVGGNAFESVALKKGSLELHSGNRFSVAAAVQGTSDVPLEYRIVTVGGTDAGEWKAIPAGISQKFDLPSPVIRQGDAGTTYHFEVEARDRQQRIVARRPLSFKLRIEATSEL